MDVSPVNCNEVIAKQPKLHGPRRILEPWFYFVYLSHGGEESLRVEESGHPEQMGRPSKHHELNCVFLSISSVNQNPSVLESHESYKNKHTIVPRVLEYNKKFLYV